MTQNSRPSVAPIAGDSDRQPPLKVLHLVSGETGNPVVSGMLLPLLLRGDRRAIQKQVVHFTPGSPLAAVTRQAGIPVHELKLSSRRSLWAARELFAVARAFRPDVVHAWGPLAHVAATLLARALPARPRQILSFTGTEPFAVEGPLAGLGRKAWVRMALTADSLVYPSQASRTRHERIGLAGQHAVIAPGVDVERYRPDFAARKRVREQLELPANAFVVGMQAPFQTMSDHVTFLKAAGELIRVNPHTQILLAGRGVQRGNAPLMALVGGGTLATRVRLLGEWSDTAGLFNACDVVCSTALTDELATNLAMAMLCGVPCIATGIGAQGEVIGKFGIGVEPGGEASLLRALTRIVEMPPERRAFLARGARRNALAHYSQQRSIQLYHALYRSAAAPEQAVAAAPAEPLQVEEPESLTAA